MIAIYDKQSKILEVHTTKTAAAERLNVSLKTLYNWMGDQQKEYKSFLIYFSVKILKSKNLNRESNF